MSEKNILHSTNLPNKEIPQIKTKKPRRSREAEPTPFISTQTSLSGASKGTFKDASNPLWLSISEAAKISGVQTKTIRRAIQSNAVKYKVTKNRYLVDFASMIIYLYSKKKLRNKLKNFGIGQYINEWK